jgi:hypothetical protein
MSDQPRTGHTEQGIGRNGSRRTAESVSWGCGEVEDWGNAYERSPPTQSKPHSGLSIIPFSPFNHISVCSCPGNAGVPNCGMIGLSAYPGTTRLELQIVADIGAQVMIDVNQLSNS